MSEVKLTQGYVTIVDDDDIALVNQHRWHVRHWGYTHYAQTNIKNQTVPLHRFLMSPPATMQVDHIDGDGLNNQRANLRVVSQFTNQRNQRNRVWKHGLPGMTLHHSGRWISHCSTEGKPVYLGMYPTKEKAHEAYLNYLALNNDPRHGLRLPSADPFEPEATA